MDVFKYLWIFMVGMLSGDMTDMLIRRYQSWLSEAKRKEYHSGYSDAYREWERVQEYNKPNGQSDIDSVEERKKLWQDGYNIAMELWNQAKINENPDNRYNLGREEGYNEGLRAGQAMRDTGDAYNKGYNKGMEYVNSIMIDNNNAIDEHNRTVRLDDNDTNLEVLT